MTDPGRDIDIDPIPGAFDAQISACATLGSTTAVRILTCLQTDYANGGVTRRLMEGRFERPVHDAATLRLLAGLHHLALSDGEHRLTRHFPTTGGTPGEDLEDIVIATMSRDHTALDAALTQPVQTNEVGRSVVLTALAHWLGSLGHSRFDLVEVGSSAGLNLNFQNYFVDTGRGTSGDIDSAVVFDASWFAVPPPLVPEPAKAVRVVGSDPHPVAVATEDGRRRLLSFVWPDHVDRFKRLHDALEIARRHPPDVRQMSAETAVDTLVDTPLVRPTVVFHSITWQYMGERVQDDFRSALRRASRGASRESPLVWVRMEPAGRVADVRASTWSGKDVDERLLCEVGYHGRDMTWRDVSLN